MAFQWTLVAAFLYSEVAFIIFLLLPIISPRVWKSVFSSRIAHTFASKANLYFTIFIAILILFFLESLREMHKYSSSLETEHMRLDAEINLRVKLFRSQRNFYIAGFALFLWLVIRRLIVLILMQANLTFDLEATMRQAQSLTDKAESLIKQLKEQEKEYKEALSNAELSEKESSEIKLAEVHSLLSRAEDELQCVKTDLITVKQKASAVSSEYNALLQEHNALQEKLIEVTKGSDKKDD